MCVTVGPAVHCASMLAVGEEATEMMSLVGMSQRNWWAENGSLE